MLCLVLPSTEAALKKDSILEVTLIYYDLNFPPIIGFIRISTKYQKPAIGIERIYIICPLGIKIGYYMRFKKRHWILGWIKFGMENIIR